MILRTLVAFSLTLALLSLSASVHAQDLSVQLVDAAMRGDAKYSGSAFGVRFDVSSVTPKP
jgi:hypothetical protein